MKKLFSLLTLLVAMVTSAWAASTVVGYTEAINESNLDARVLSNGGLEHLTISSSAIFGSAITDQGSKTVYIDNTAYTNNKSWRKSVKDTYDNQFVGYTLTVGSGYKMNISKVNARIAVADDTYTWFVEILNSAGTQVWKSSETTTTKATSGKIDNVDVTDKEDIQGLTGTVTVKLWVKQGGSTKYFSINYLQLSVELKEDNRTNYTITANVADGQESYGSIDKPGDNSVPEGDALSLTATPNTGYGFVNWTKDDVEVSTNATLTLSNVTANAKYVAHFKQLYRATYSLDTYAGTITGKVLCTYNAANNINEIYADINDNYTIPAYAHKYLYREGYTFAGWSYGGNIYNSGDVISGLTENPTITPTWTATTQTLGNSQAATEVTWSMAKADIVFMDWQSSDKYGYYTQTATVNGEKIAIPMQITKGKVGNYGRTDALAQTNQNTQFTIPAVSGMTIAISDAYTNFSTTTIAGSTEYTGTGTKSISYTYTGSAETIDIIIGESNQYLTSIVVTYPVTAANINIQPTYNKSTYVTPAALDFSAVSGLKAYVATAAASGSVTLETVTTVPAGTPLMLIGTAGIEYTVPVAASADAPAVNMFRAGDGTTTFDGSTFDYILFSDGLFYQIGSGAVPVGKAYLHCTSDPTGAATAPYLTIDFGGTTGIDSVKAADKANGEYYNLNGQRVANPTKGLYIINGRKVVIK